MILDAYAVLALFKGEAAAAAVRGLLASERLPVLTAMGVAEVLDHLVRLEGATEEDAALVLAQPGGSGVRRATRPASRASSPHELPQPRGIGRG